MKTSFNQKQGGPSVAVAEVKPVLGRSGAKSASHRYERRKIREQLRHLDWALAGVD